jgi:excisionase family DNA binding protein
MSFRGRGFVSEAAPVAEVKPNPDKSRQPDLISRHSRRRGLAGLTFKAPMNKEEAAQFVGVSVRSLERAVAAGKVAHGYAPGKTRDLLDFDEGELQRFKDEMEAARQVVPAAIPTSPPNAATALARLPARGQIEAARGTGPANGAALAALLEALAARPPVPIADRLLLTIQDAQELTGLSRATLRAAIDEKKLKAQKIGRAFRIKRSALDEFIKKL